MINALRKNKRETKKAKVKFIQLYIVDNIEIIFKQ